MTDKPCRIERFIGLITDHELDRDLVRAWYACVTDKAPSGVSSTVVAHDGESRRSACLVHRQAGEQHIYLVPLTRDLTEDEAEHIISAFADQNPDIDFEVEASCLAHRKGDGTTKDIPVDQSRYMEVAQSWAKKKHNDWLKTRTDSGWRFGQNVSLTDKTHPLLRPWDELPDRFKYADVDEPQQLLDILNDSGYAVVSRDDLEAVLRLVRDLDKK